MNYLNTMYKKLKTINAIILFGGILLSFASTTTAFLYIAFFAITALDLVLVFLSKELIITLYDKEDFFNQMLQKYLKTLTICIPLEILLDQSHRIMLMVTLIYTLVLMYSYLIKGILKYITTTIGTLGLLFIVAVYQKNSMQAYDYLAIMILLSYLGYLQYNKKPNIIKKNELTLVALTFITTMYIDYFYAFTATFILIEIFKMTKTSPKIIYMAAILFLLKVKIDVSSLDATVITSSSLIALSVCYKESIIKKALEVYNVWF